MNNLYSKLSNLEKADKQKFDNSKQYMNTFYYILSNSQYNENNIGSSLKMNRNEAINILKSIYLTDNKQKKVIKQSKEYKKYMILPSLS